MFRPVGLFNNEYSFYLMKNRHEEWGEIPKEYVESITYRQGEPMTMKINIPDRIVRHNAEIELDLYKVIRGKMHIIMKLNDEYCRFIIDDKIGVTETRAKNTKTITAYSFEKTLEKKNFVNSQGLTRQLYRPADEKVEVGEGILNIFENQTSFKIGHVDDAARKENIWHSKTRPLTILKNKTVNEVKVDSVVWELDVTSLNISAGDMPMSMTISYPDMETYSGDLLQKKECITHTFYNLPFSVRKIQARYTSDSEQRYGLTYTITYNNKVEKLHYDENTKQYSAKEVYETADFKFAYANCNKLKLVLPSVELSHETGEMTNSNVTKYRYFEQNTLSWWNMIADIEEAFDVVCMFEYPYNPTTKKVEQVLNVYDKKTFGDDTDITISYDNAIKEVSKSHKISDVITRLYVNSPNVSINGENPLGTSYVEDFSYFMNNNIMSNSLKNAMQKYNKLLETTNTTFLKLRDQKNTIDQRLIKAQGELTSFQGQWQATNAILSGYLKAQQQLDEENENYESDKKMWQAKIDEHSNKLASIESQIEQKLKEISDYQTQSNNLLSQMNQLGIDIMKTNAKDSNGKIFTADDIEELEDYLVEGSITNDYYTTSYGLYAFAKDVIADMNKIYIDFTINTYDFLNNIVAPNNWNNKIKIGSRFALVDQEELTDDEGLIQLYGYVFKPNENNGQGKVDSLSFTNNKKPKTTAIRTIGDVAKKTTQVTTMTNFWKDTWQKSAQNNLVVEDMLNNGLDVAAQVVRGKGTVNKIEITESGIYVIDAVDDKKQIYYGSGLICITEDKWKHATTAIDSTGVMANTIVGKLLLGEKLVIANEDNTFQINPSGISLTNTGDTVERIFIGIRDKKATFELRSSGGNNSLVLSEDGIYQVFPIQARDSFDRYKSFKINFYLPSNLTRLDSASINLGMEKFRAYSKSAASQDQEVVSLTTETYDAVSSTTKEAGGTTKTVTSSEKAKTSSTTSMTSSSQATKTYTSTSSSQARTSVSSTTKSGGYVALKSATTANINIGGDLDNHIHVANVNVPNHTHTVNVTVPAHSHSVSITVPAHSHTVSSSVTIPAHSHTVSYTIPSHKHKIDISAHKHKVNVTVPKHTHNLVHGIFDYEHYATCDIYVDGNLVASNVTGDTNANIMKHLKKDSNGSYGGTHTIEIRSKSSKDNPDGLGRANVNILIGGFISY